MKNLTQLREQIDAVDKQIVELFEQRMQISADVAKYKISISSNLLSITLINKKTPFRKIS